MHGIVKEVWDPAEARRSHDGSLGTNPHGRRYGESPPESSLNTKAPTMNARRIATAIEVTGLTAATIVLPMTKE